MYTRIQTDLVNGDLPGYRKDYKQTRYVESLGKYVGLYDGPALVEHSSYTGPWPINARKNTYTGPQFYKALTVTERESLINKSKSSDSAGAIFEQIKLLGLNFNDSDDIAIIDKMVVAGILNSTRRDALVG